MVDCSSVVVSSSPIPNDTPTEEPPPPPATVVMKTKKKKKKKDRQSDSTAPDQQQQQQHIGSSSSPIRIDTPTEEKPVTVVKKTKKKKKDGSENRSDSIATEQQQQHIGSSSSSPILIDTPTEEKPPVTVVKKIKKKKKDRQSDSIATKQQQQQQHIGASSASPIRNDTPTEEKPPVTVVKKTKKKKNDRQNDSIATEQQQQQQQQQQHIGSSSASSPPSKRRKKSDPGVRVIKGSRIYDSENGKSCHQCRQKTLDFVATCTNYNDKKHCTLNVCHKCLFNRYGEKAEEAVALGNWKCPKCRGICNCSLCMKKRGMQPTGILLHSAKSTGFSSVSEMLYGKGSESKVDARNETPAVASSGECDEGSGCDGKSDSISQPQLLENGKETSTGKLRKFEDCEECEGNRDNSSYMKKCSYKKRRIYMEEPNEGNETYCRDDNGRISNKVEVQNKICPIEIPPLPQGTELNTVAATDMPAEDVGHALQFLEFCEAFGKVINLNEGQPELLLRDLVCWRSRRRMEDSSVVQFQIQLLSMIGEHSGKEYPSSWLQALNKCISESPYILKELKLDGFDADGGGYDELDSSKKLRLLNFLCDEALGTKVLRNWIDEQNSKHVTREKNIKEEVLAAEKSMKKKVQNEVVQAVLAENGAPLSISEYENLVSKIKAEAAQTLRQTIKEADSVLNKEHRADAVRSVALLFDGNGHKFWKLRGFSGEMCRQPISGAHKIDILLQDIRGDFVASNDRWFTYDVEQKAMVEDYISSSRKLSE